MSFKGVDYEYYDIDINYDYDNGLIIASYDTPAIRMQKEDKNKIEAKLRKLESKFSMNLCWQINEDLENYVATWKDYSYKTWRNFEGIDPDNVDYQHSIDCKFIDGVHNILREKLESIVENNLI